MSYLAHVTLIAFLKAWSAGAMPVHTKVDRWLHVSLTFSTCQLLDETFIVISLQKRVQDCWKERKIVTKVALNSLLNK